PIGTTMVTCAATDSHSNTSTGTFTVTVTSSQGSPAAMIRSLLDDVRSSNVRVPAKVVLANFLRQALGAVILHKPTLACHKLDQFITAADRFTLKPKRTRVTASVASDWMDEAQRIQGALGCS